MTTYANGTDTTPPPAIVAGRVQAVKGNGFKIGDEWVNVSKFARGVELPAKGAQVRAVLDKSGFARRVELVDDVPAPAVNGVHTAAHAVVPSQQTPDSTTARIAALAAAVALVAALPAQDAARRNVDLAGDVVIDLAERFESWVLR